MQKAGWESPLQLPAKSAAFLGISVALFLTFAGGHSASGSAMRATTPNDAFDKLNRIAPARFGADFGCVELDAGERVELKVVGRRALKKARSLIKELKLSDVTKVRKVRRRYSRDEMRTVYRRASRSIESMPEDQRVLYEVSYEDDGPINRCPPVLVRGQRTGATEFSVGWVLGLQSALGADRLKFEQVDLA